MQSIIKRFVQSTHGAVSIVYPFVFIIMIMIMAGAVDYGRYILVSNKLQTAIDSAALSAVVKITQDPDLNNTSDLQLEFTNAFDGNYVPADYLGSTIKVGPTIVQQQPSGLYRADASVEIPTALLHLFGFDSTAYGKTVEIATEGGSTTPINGEVTLVLDVTVSMNDPLILTTKTQALQGAVTNFLNKLYGTKTELQNLTLNFVYFGPRVNVGPNPNWSKFPVGFDGHLTARAPTPVAFLDVSDAAPSTAGNTRFFNYNPADGAYAEAGPLPPIRFGVTRKVDALSATRQATPPVSNNTATNIGLLWGWQTLSPKWAGLFDNTRPTLPKPYDEPNHKKIIILVTDGENNYPYGDNPSVIGNTHMAALCGAIKNKDVEIYTIALAIDDPIAIVMLAGCATDADHFFNVLTRNRLEVAFDEIVDDLLINKVVIVE